MNYIGWSDGSYFQNHTGYIAYVIKREDNKEERFCGYFEFLRDSQEAESFALFHMFKRVLELGIKNISLYTDCQGLEEKLGSKNDTSQDNSIQKMFENAFGTEKISLLKENLKWKTRKENLAHFLFENIQVEVPKLSRALMECKNISIIPSEFQGEEYFDSPLLQLRNTLKKHCQTPNSFERSDDHFVITFNDEKVQVPARILNSFKKSVHHTDDQDVLMELRNKLLSSTIVEKDDQILFQKGRLMISLKNYVIQDLKIDVAHRKETDLLEREIKPIDLPKTYDIRNRPITNLENFPLPILTKVHNKFTKKKDLQTALNSLRKTLSSGPFVTVGNVQLYLKGKLHVMVENGVIVDIRTQVSQYTVQKNKRLAV